MSGAGTNSGIDYQQRVSALFLAYMFSGLDIADILNMHDSLVVQEIHFETDNPIDDLNIICQNDNILLFQIKRALSLSNNPESEFYKTIAQFVRQFVRHKRYSTKYILVTSSDASKKILKELKKILESIRLNDVSFAQNPLNDSEANTYEKYLYLFQHIFTQETRANPSTKDFIEFSKLTYITCIDVEQDMPLEKAAIMILKSKGVFSPGIIWSLLIKNSLYYASKRMSVNLDAINNLLNRYILKKEGNINDELLSIEDELPPEIIFAGEFAVGKEVLLVEQPLDDDETETKTTYMIIELFRFDDACNKKIEFFDIDKALFPGNSTALTVIHRCSSQSGMERFISEQEESFFKDKEIILVPANGIEQIEKSECARIYREYCDQLLKENKNLLKCLHCNKGMTSGEVYLVEIDEQDLKAAIGSVHSSCLRPIDRVLAKLTLDLSEELKSLKNFDFKRWIKLVVKGQGAFRNLSNIPSAFSPIIAWSSDEEYDADYSYCIRYTLSDGSIDYVSNRGKIVRYSKVHAEEDVKFFEESRKAQKAQNDPSCVTTKSGLFGKYSLLLSAQKEDDEILEVISYEMVKYSNLIKNVYNDDRTFYAPVCLLRHPETEQIVNLANLIPVIIDPFRSQKLVMNWNDAGFDVPDWELKIVQDDKDFDNYMRMFFGHSMTPIVEPMFDKNANLVKGVFFGHMEQMLAEKMEMERQSAESGGTD